MTNMECKTSIMEQLYEAPIGYNGRPYEPDSDFVNTAHLRGRNLDALLEHLTDEQKELFEKYADADNELTSIEKFDKFSYGVHLGTLFMLEIMNGKEEMER